MQPRIRQYLMGMFILFLFSNVNPQATFAQHDQYSKPQQPVHCNINDKTCIPNPDFPPEGCTEKGCPIRLHSTECTKFCLDGIDPAETSCASDAFTVVTRIILNYRTNEHMGTVELRYSPSCGTNWIRTTRWGPVTTLWATVVRGSDQESYQTINGQSSQVWSKMVYAPNVPAGGSGCINDQYQPNCEDTGMY